MPDFLFPARALPNTANGGGRGGIQEDGLAKILMKRPSLVRLARHLL